MPWNCPLAEGCLGSFRAHCRLALSIVLPPVTVGIGGDSERIMGGYITQGETWGDHCGIGLRQPLCGGHKRLNILNATHP